MKRIILVIGIGLILSSIFAKVYAGETITLSTYYPAPYGEYQTLSVGDGYVAPDSDTDIDLVVEGNVGIGTAGPGYTLTVEKDGANNYLARFYNTDATAGENWGVLINAGSTSADASFRVKNYANTATYLHVRGDGNVGIGTSSPDNKLHVETSDVIMALFNNTGTLNAGIRISVGTDDDISFIDFGDASDTNDGGISYDHDNRYLGFRSQDVGDRMVIKGANVGIGTTGPSTLLEVEETETIDDAVTDGYAAAITLDPGYTAATAQTVTRHNYIDVQNVPEDTAAVTDACVLRFNAAAGTHKAVDSGTTKATPGTVNAWLKVNIDGTIYYIPAYTDKTD